MLTTRAEQSFIQRRILSLLPSRLLSPFTLPAVRGEGIDIIIVIQRQEVDRIGTYEAVSFPQTQTC